MPFDVSQKPDLGLITKQEEHLERVWANAVALIARAYSFYGQENDIWEELRKANPREWAKRPQYHSGRATSVIDHAVDAQLAFQPRFRRRPVGDGQAHEEKANRLEKGLQHVVSDAVLKSMFIPAKINGKQLAMYNYTQLYVGLDAEMLRRPERKKGEDKEDFGRREWEWEGSHNTWNPVVIEVPSPGEVLMEPGKKIPSYAIRRKKDYAYNLADLTLTKLRKLGEANIYEITGDPYDEVEFLEWWSPRYVAVATKGGKLLYVEDNSWGFVPFSHTFSGAADIPINEGFDPALLVAQSLLFKVMDNLVLRDQRLVANHQLLIRAAYAKRGYSGDAAEGAAQQEGDLLQGEEDMWWVEKFPELPQSMFQHGEEIDANIEEGTFSLQAAGFRQSGVDTATQQIILSEKTDRTFRHITMQMGALWSIGGSMILKLAKRMDSEYGEGAIWVGADPLNVSDMGDEYHISASFEQVDAVVALQEKRDAREELAAGIIDRDTYYRIARYENPTEIEEGILEDEIMRMDVIHQEMALSVMRKKGFGELANRLEGQIRQGGLVGPDGQPISSGGTGGGPPQVPSPQNPISRGVGRVA